MSKKELLNETQIRRFMKLANLEPLASNVLKEGDGQIPQPATDQGSVRAGDEARLKEEVGMEDEGMEGGKGLSMEAEEPEMPELDDKAEAGAEGGDAELMDFLEKLKSVLKPDLAAKLDLESSEEGEEAEMDMGGEEGDEEEGDEEEGEEDMDEAMKPEEKDENKSLSEDALVETVLARVTARLMEAAKKAKKKGVAGKMAAKKAAKPAANKPAKEEEKKTLEEATSAEGGGPLLKQGKNKYDPWKGHADMTMAKGDKGGKGGHQMETVTAKAEHTVTHGGKNLATMGGNKTKV